MTKRAKIDRKWLLGGVIAAFLIVGGVGLALVNSRNYYVKLTLQLYSY